LAVAGGDLFIDGERHRAAAALLPRRALPFIGQQMFNRREKE
jgi:hypothetical protein